MNTYKKRLLAAVLATAMAMSAAPVGAHAEAASDLDGHWAQAPMEEWADYGVIRGYEDGTMRPNAKITRAELTAMLDRVMDYQVKADNHFSDLADGAWFTDVILGANAAGVIRGYEDDTIRPNATITRQEAAAMFARVLSLDLGGQHVTFADEDEIAGWARDSVMAMAAAGYIHGDRVGDNIESSFRPNDGITRAEVITIFNNIFDDLYQKSGSVSENIDGSAVVNTDDVVLKDMEIKGDLVVAEGVGDGDVTLDGVKLDGKLIVRGGGEHSVIIKGDTTVGDISVERRDSKVRLAVADSASVEDVAVTNEGKGVILDGDATSVSVDAAGAEVDVTGTVESASVAKGADDVTLTLKNGARLDQVSTAADDTTVVVERGANASAVAISGSGTTVKGDGKVASVTVADTAKDTTVSTKKTDVTNNSSEAVQTGKPNQTINPGTEGTTPGGSTSGSIGGGGGGTTVTRYSVSFIDAAGNALTDSEGNPIESQRVASGQTVTLPTVTVAEGQKVSWYTKDANGTLALFDTQTKITADTTLVAITGSDKFTAGNGSAAAPYLINDAEQLKAIEPNDNADAPVYYSLTADIDLAGQTGTSMVPTAQNIVLDGQEHKISSSEKTGLQSVIYQATGTTTIKNINYDLTNLDSNSSGLDLSPLVWQLIDTGVNIVFQNINVTGNHSVDGNNGPIVMFDLMRDSQLTLDQCTMAANLEGRSYNGAFIGGHSGSDTIVTVRDCTISGNMVCEKPGAVAGNAYNGKDNKVEVNYKFENTNTISGTIRGTVTAHYGIGTHPQTLTQPEEAAKAGWTEAAGEGQNLYVAHTDNTLSINVADDQSITITPSDSDQVTKYEVAVGFYSKTYNDDKATGTMRIYRTETIDEALTEARTINLKAYGFADVGLVSDPSAITKDALENNIVTLDDGQTYFVIDGELDNDGDICYVGSPTEPKTTRATLITVNAYTADGKLYSTATYKK
ncbi:MAG: S-layer homology domain-containing protein [Peptococcaceae bacterium]|nr:S-layer homology domain-containing protein [Peptococcaceae bacterium]